MEMYRLLSDAYMRACFANVAFAHQSAAVAAQYYAPLISAMFPTRAERAVRQVVESPHGGHRVIFAAFGNREPAGITA